MLTLRAIGGGVTNGTISTSAANMATIQFRLPRQTAGYGFGVAAARRHGMNILSLLDPVSILAYY